MNLDGSFIIFAPVCKFNFLGGNPHLCYLDNLRYFVLDEADRIWRWLTIRTSGASSPRSMEPYLLGAISAGTRRNLVYSATLTVTQNKDVYFSTGYNGYGTY